jgi:hypothetical protein
MYRVLNPRQYARHARDPTFQLAQKLSTNNLPK